MLRLLNFKQIGAADRRGRPPEVGAGPQSWRRAGPSPETRQPMSECPACRRRSRAELSRERCLVGGVAFPLPALPSVGSLCLGSAGRLEEASLLCVPQRLANWVATRSPVREHCLSPGPLCPPAPAPLYVQERPKARERCPPSSPVVLGGRGSRPLCVSIEARPGAQRPQDSRIRSPRELSLPPQGPRGDL